MKKVLKIILVSMAILIAFVFGLLTLIGHAYNEKLGEGHFYLYNPGFEYIRSTQIKTLYLADILGIKFDDNFIIAQRIPANFFSCPNESKVIFSNKLQYLIIDKKANKIYGTYDKDSFIKMREKLNIKIDFSNENQREIKSKMIRKQRNYNNEDEDLEHIKKYCKEIDGHSLIEY